MVPDREPYLSRARDCARLTIPSLIPPDAYPNRSMRFPSTYQSVGARGVNHLASKIILALFPPNMPFMRYVPDNEELQQRMDADKQTQGGVEEALGREARALKSDFERAALRVPLSEAAKHLLVGGNILFHMDPKTNQGRAIPLSRYVVKRDPQGNVLEGITKEDIDHDALPPDIYAKLEETEVGDEDEATEKEDGEREVYELYTRFWRTPKWWRFEQEIEGKKVGEGRVKLDACPWMALRMVAVDGEDYGRSLIEEYYGDLASLERLSKAVNQFAAAAAKIVFLVKPNAATKPNKLSKAASGDFVQGNKSDVEVLQLEKYADFQVVKATMDTLTERLSYAFLMASAIQRNGERVTAEEIRLMAQELDAGFGGIYATLSQELQMPIALLLQANRRRAGKVTLPHFDKLVRPTLVTGVEALGRNQELTNLLNSMQILGQYPAFVQRLIGGELIKRVFAANNVDPKGLVMDEETFQKLQAQQNAANAMAPAGAEAVKAYARQAGAVAAQPPSVEAASASGVTSAQPLL